jgi:predicted heme/steroid binding protein
MKKIFVVISLILVLMMSGCSSSKTQSGGSSSSSSSSSKSTSTSKVFTLAQLKTYDGQNGSSAYVAIDGVVYDVTNSPKWQNGQHHGNSAGEDLSSVIDSSPHGRNVLANLPVVGKLK